MVSWAIAVAYVIFKIQNGLIYWCRADPAKFIVTRSVEAMSIRFKHQSPFPLLMIVFGVILVLGSIFWFVYTTGAVAPRTTSVSPEAPSQSVPNPEIRRVSLADAKAAYDLGTATFIDVRGDTNYSQGHIPGAISIAVSEIENHLNELDPSAWIITYCT